MHPIMEILEPYELNIEEFKIDSGKEIFIGLCYQKAYEYIMHFYSEENSEEIPDSFFKLIHGAIRFPDLPLYLGHAWVELDNKVIFDGVFQRFYPKNVYLKILSAIRIIDFDINEILSHTDSEQYYGPWHPIELFDVYNIKKNILIKSDNSGRQYNQDKLLELLDKVEFGEDGLTPINIKSLY